MKDRESERTLIATSHLSHLIYVDTVSILFVFSIINTLLNKRIKQVNSKLHQSKLRITNYVNHVVLFFVINLASATGCDANGV